MRKRIILAAGIAALGLSACSSASDAVTDTTIETTEETVADTSISEETDEGEEIFVGDAETEEQELGGVMKLVTSKATYREDSGRTSSDQAFFESPEGGEFICNISDITELPEGGLTDGETYTITHTNVMAMSYPGIIPTVYSIRTADDEMIDTAAVLETVDENAKQLLFSVSDGNQFLTDLPAEETFTEGETYIVTHDQAMTRSLPGKYMNVTRIIPAV